MSIIELDNFIKKLSANDSSYFYGIKSITVEKYNKGVYGTYDHKNFLIACYKFELFLDFYNRENILDYLLNIKLTNTPDLYSIESLKLNFNYMYDYIKSICKIEEEPRLDNFLFYSNRLEYTDILKLYFVKDNKLANNIIKIINHMVTNTSDVMVPQQVAFSYINDFNSTINSTMNEYVYVKQFNNIVQNVTINELEFKKFISTSNIAVDSIISFTIYKLISSNRELRSFGNITNFSRHCAIPFINYITDNKILPINYELAVNFIRKEINKNITYSTVSDFLKNNSEYDSINSDIIFKTFFEKTIDPEPTSTSTTSTTDITIPVSIKIKSDDNEEEEDIEINKTYYYLFFILFIPVIIALVIYIRKYHKKLRLRRRINMSPNRF